MLRWLSDRRLDRSALSGRVHGRVLALGSLLALGAGVMAVGWFVVSPRSRATDGQLAHGLAWSPKGNTIAVSVSGPNPGIALIDASSGDQQRLAVPLPSEMDILAWLSFSPDGEALAVTAIPSPQHHDVEHMITRGSRVLVVDTRSGRVRREITGAYAAWSPDGTEVYVDSGPQTLRGISRVRIDGSAAKAEQVCRLNPCPFQMSVSPNGRWLAFCASTPPEIHGSAIHMYRWPLYLWRTKDRKCWLAHDFLCGPVALRWSADSQALVCVGDEGDLHQLDPTATVFVVRPATRRVEKALSIPGNDNGLPSLYSLDISPKCDAIAFQCGEAGSLPKDRRLVVQSLSGGQRAVLDQSEGVSLLAWSPRGDQVAGVKEDKSTGRAELWLYSPDGSSARRLCALR
jgi:Tol biopolymer transport system component